MGFDRELTRQLLGDVGPLRFNPRVVKVCDHPGCGRRDVVRYKGGKKPTAPYHCSKCRLARPETRAKLALAAARQWKDAAFRERVRASSRQLWKDAAFRAKMEAWSRSHENVQALVARNVSRNYDDVARTRTPCDLVRPSEGSRQEEASLPVPPAVTAAD